MADTTTCEGFASSWGISVDSLEKLNPGITCPDLDTSKYYCVIGTATDDESTTSQIQSTTLKTSTITTSTTTKATTAQVTTTKVATTTAAASNTATMPGVASNCDEFYKVSSGDTCETIASRYSIALAQFKGWNTEINDDCTNLWLDYYVCVHVPGATATATTSSEAAQPTATTGPTPQMPGIVDNCKTFHQVVTGDGCWSIYTDAGITFEQFREYNTQIDSDCSNLWAGYYVCIGI